MRNLIALSAAMACLSGAAWGQAQQAGQCSFTPTGTGVVSCGVPMPITTPAFGSGVFTFKGLSSNGAVSIQTAPDNGRATGPTWSTAGAASADGSVSVNLVGVNAVQILVTATGSTPVNVSWLFQSQAASTTPGAPGSGGTVTANPPAVTPQATASAATSKVLKASAGNLYSFTGLSTVAGYYLVFDSATDPGNGAVTPKYCIGAYPANTVGGASWGSALASFSNGITVVFSTTGCFTETQSATAFISGQVSP